MNRGTRKNPREVAKEFCRLNEDQTGFESRFINEEIGRGTFTTKIFRKGDFLLEYRGELITFQEGERREEIYPEDAGSFLFFFGKWCVDATEATNGLGRLVNDLEFKHANSVMKVLKFCHSSKPHLCLFATRDIQAGEELRFDYGVGDLPWRKQKNTTDQQAHGSEDNEVPCSLPGSEDESQFDVLPYCRNHVAISQNKNFPIPEQRNDGNLDELPSSESVPGNATTSLATTHIDSVAGHVSHGTTAVEMKPFCKKRKAEVESDAYSDVSEFSDVPSPEDDSDNDPDFMPSDDGIGHEPYEVEREKTSTCTDHKLKETPEKQSSLELDKGAETVPRQSVHLGEKMPSLKRMCPFCEKYFTEKLSRHITLKHGDRDEVKKALQAPKKERLEQFSRFKKEGIYKANKMIAGETDPSFYQERRSRAKSRLIMCGNCMGFFSSRYLGRHKKHCEKESSTRAYDVPAGLLNKHDDEVEDPLFFHNILCAFNDDDVGNICRTDSMILTVGRRLWHKEKRKFDKKMEVKKSVMTAMRRLGHLYVHFRNTKEELGAFDESEGCAVDMFSRGNFKHLESAVKTYCQKSGENQPGEDLKYGLKTALYYLIKSACKIMKGTYLIEDKDSKADGLDRFVEVLELNHDFVFGDAVYATNKSQKEKLRKPNLLPVENDVALVRDYTLTKLEEITSNEYYHLAEGKGFTELRNLIVSRLTLYNARRGGEPCRLSRKEWDEAENGTWINKNIEDLNDAEKKIMENMKITYQSGKGKHLVPVLIPSDCFEPIRILNDDDVRANSGVRRDNPYLFPCTQNSEEHVSGWHAVHNVCVVVPEVEQVDLITATKNRHRVSTLYAAMDVNESERHYFYQHMGHSEKTNADTYQAPLALMEVLKVGPSLSKIDAPPCDTIQTEARPAHRQRSSNRRPLQQLAPEAQHPRQDEENRKRAPPCDTIQSEDRPAHRQRSSNRRPLQQLAPEPQHPPQDQENRKARKYIQWTTTQTETVVNHFRKYIRGETSKRLPDRKELEAFAARNSKEVPYDTLTIKTKVYNEKKKFDQRSQQRLQHFEKSLPII